MVKQLHSVTGSVLLRLAVVEGGMANVVAANNKPLDAEDVRQIQVRCGETRKPGQETC